MMFSSSPTKCAEWKVTKKSSQKSQFFLLREEPQGPHKQKKSHFSIVIVDAVVVAVDIVIVNLLLHEFSC